MSATDMGTDRYAEVRKILGSRVQEALDRASRKGAAPAKLTLFTSGSAGAAAVEALAADPTCHVERRAPGVYYVEMLGKHLDAVLGLAKHLERIEGGARVHGARVENAGVRVSVVFQAPRPLTAEHTRELAKLAVVVQEQREDGDVEAEAPGGAIAPLARLPWVGPVEVRS